MNTPRRALGLSVSLLLISVLAGTGCDPRSFRQEAERGGSELAASPAGTDKPVVEVFVTDWCPYCRRLEAFLQENEVAYVRKDIEKSGDWQREHRALGGGGGIPVTRVGSEVVWGFRPDVIGPLVGVKAD